MNFKLSKNTKVRDKHSNIKVKEKLRWHCTVAKGHHKLAMYLSQNLTLPECCRSLKCGKFEYVSLVWEKFKLLYGHNLMRSKGSCRHLQTSLLLYFLVMQSFSQILIDIAITKPTPSMIKAENIT